MATSAVHRVEQQRVAPLQFRPGSKETRAERTPPAEGTVPPEINILARLAFRKKIRVGGEPHDTAF